MGGLEQRGMEGGRVGVSATESCKRVKAGHECHVDASTELSVY